MGEDIQVIITGIVGLISTVVSGWVSWLFAKRKYNAEVDSNIIENMKQSLDFYIKLSDDNKARLEEALKKNEILENEIRQLRQQVFDLMNNVYRDLKKEVEQKKPRKVKNTKTDKSNNHDTKEGK